MFVKIEPSGCVERKGMAQIRLDLFLDSTDYGYEKCYLNLPVIPAGEKYPGKVDDMGIPIKQKDFDKWVDSFPKAWINTPFLNHFIQVEPTATTEDITDMAGAVMQEAFIKWNQDLDLGEEHQVYNYTKFPHDVPRSVEDDALAYYAKNGTLPISFLAKIGKTATEYLNRKAACETKIQSVKTITTEIR